MSLSLGLNKKYLFFSIFFLLLLSPLFSFAQNNAPVTSAPPVPTDTGITYECPPVLDRNGVTVYGECRFEHLLAAVQKVLTWGRNFALMFSVIVIAWAGFNLMISGDNPSKRNDAKKMLGKVALGIVYILAAWLIVTLLLNALGASSVVQLG